MCWCTIAAISGSMGPMTWSNASTTVTKTPRARRFSAISRPMKPAPTITARSGRLASTYSLIPSMSGTERRVKTPGLSMPGIGGLTGSAPGERTRAS